MPKPGDEKCKKCREKLTTKGGKLCKCWRRKLKGKTKRPKYPQIKPIPYGEGIEKLPLSSDSAPSHPYNPGRTSSDDDYRRELDEYGLTDREELIVRLHRFEGWSFKEIADELGIAKSSAAYEFGRIKAKMRREHEK